MFRRTTIERLVVPESVYRRCWANVLLLGLGVAAFTGCGSKQRAIERQAVYPVTGVLLLGGVAASGAHVSFHPVGGTGPGRGFPARGLVDGEGKFQLTTYTTGDGAPEGDYIVTVYWAAPQPAASHDEEDDDSANELPPDRLGGRFRSAGTSKLRAHVAPQPTNFAPLDLSGPEVTQGGEVHLRPE